MKFVFLVIAWVCVALGLIGAFVPILPTTPFLLLAAFLFSKSSPRFHTWLLNLPLAGEAIADWQNSKVIRPKAKLLCTSMILLSLSVMWFKANVFIGLKLTISITLILLNIFVLTRKSR